MNGAKAIDMGAIWGGLQLISAYPMSPSTFTYSFITERAKKKGIVSEQVEDEIASINIALGASLAGVRVMTTTSGGGLALMVEGISLSGVAEIPIVIVKAQRSGPATGLPTRTAQEDLFFTLHAGHGEFPRFVFAPGDVEEALYTTAHVLNLAEKYQIPVIILADQYLTDSYQTIKALEPGQVTHKSHLASEEEIQKKYLRYKITSSGVSPIAYFGQGDVTFMVDSHEHTADGHITEDGLVRQKMVEKRFRKLRGMRREFGGPAWYGPNRDKAVFVCWVRLRERFREAVDILEP